MANLCLGLFAIAVSNATIDETIHYVSSSLGNDQNDGLSEETSFVDSSGDRWNVDEYGDRSYMWDYL